MNEMVEMILSLFVGFVLGVVFFGGLWWTVKKGMQSKNTGLIFVVSFIIRMAIVFGGFYTIVQFGWKQALVCLAGFLMARVAVVRLTKSWDDQSSLNVIKEAQHETES